MERSDAAKVAIQCLLSHLASGHSTISTKEPAGFNELCREGLLKKQPINGDYVRFAITDKARRLAAYEKDVAQEVTYWPAHILQSIIWKPGQHSHYRAEDMTARLAWRITPNPNDPMGFVLKQRVPNLPRQ